jgi:hypothetical protein
MQELPWCRRCQQDRHGSGICHASC